jgi:hypothetical protein
MEDPKILKIIWFGLDCKSFRLQLKGWLNAGGRCEVWDGIVGDTFQSTI